MALSKKQDAHAWGLLTNYVTSSQTHVIWMNEELKFTSYYILKDKTKSRQSKLFELKTYIQQKYPDLYNNHFKGE